MNLNKKFFTILFSIVLFIFSGGLREVSASSPTVSELSIVYPVSGYVISGNTSIVFEAPVTGVGPIVFNINLYQKDCVTLVQQVYSGSEVEIYGEYYKYVWDTTAIKDGNYCLDITTNVSMSNNLNDNGRIIIKISNNGGAAIAKENTGFKVITTKLGNSIKYRPQTINTTNPKFEIINAPQWINLNSANGEISAAASEEGTFNMILKATDEKNNELYYEPIALNVGAQDKLITFGDVKVLSNEKNKIEWTAKDDVTEQLLEYSSNGLSWVSISDLTDTQRNAVWDLGDVESGEYILRLTASTDDGYVSSWMSKTVVHNERQEEKFLYNISPLDGSNVYYTTPQIGGDFNVLKIIDVAKVQIYLDGVEITKDCKFSDGGFSCSMLRDLEQGLHKVKAVFDDENDETWTFNISLGEIEEEVVEEESATIPTVNTQTLIIVGAICGVILLLLFIPWVLYLIWSRKHSSKDVEEEENDDIANEEMQKDEFVEPQEIKIGSQDLTSEVEPSGTINYDASAQEPEVPRWLSEDNYSKDINVSEASKPVNTQGEATPKPLKNELPGSQPYGVYGNPDDEI